MGIDGIFIGPMDLSTTMGHFGDHRHPEVQEVIHTVERKVKSAGKLLGTFASGGAPGPFYDRGYDYVIFNGDSSSLRAASLKNLSVFKEYLESAK